MGNPRKGVKVFVLLVSLSILFLTSYAGIARASEWECNDPNYPLNCNNGTCCASDYFCCYAACCPSGSLCCQTGCCPPGSIHGFARKIIGVMSIMMTPA